MKKFRICCLGIFLAVCMLVGCGKQEEEQETSEEITTAGKVEMNLWYTDESIGAYLASAAEAFGQEHNVIITPMQVSAIDYLENINQKNIDGTDMVDIYILNSESLEKAYMSGLTTVLDKDMSNYPNIAESACYYQGKMVAYPVYFETEYFLYNKDIVAGPPESFQAIIDFASSDEMSGEQAELYQNLENILKWDVLDLFCNYQFVGAYLNIGGEDRDNRDIVDMNNEKVLEALSFYKGLNQSLYFDAEEVDYQTMIQSFLEGRLLYTIGTTDSLGLLQQSEMNYGISAIPPLTDSLESKGISINYVAAVNPYSEAVGLAEEFADYISDSYADKCYELSGMLPCKKLDSYAIEEFAYVVEAYEKSAQLPKLMDTTNFWVELEVVLNDIWKAEMREEEAEEGLTDSSQADNIGAEEKKREQMQKQIRDLVTGEIDRAQEQMQRQLSQ